MNQSLYCDFCHENGHSIQFCRNPQIANAFRYLIQINISSQDFIEARNILADYTDVLIKTISIQMTRTVPEESREHHIEKIIEAIQLETNYLRQLSGIQRDEYLRWLNPNDIVDDVLNMATIYERLPDENTSERPIPLLLCIESNEELRESAECGICLETKMVFDMDTFQCQHPVCHTCVLQMLVIYTNMSCPFCRTQVKTIEVKDIEHFDEIHDPPLYLYLA
jgi:hypothetical protein